MRSSMVAPGCMYLMMSRERSWQSCLVSTRTVSANFSLYLRFVRACTTVPGFYSTPLWYHCIHIIFIASYFCWLLFLCGVMWFSICWDLFLVQSVTKMSQITQKRHPDLTNRISHGGHIGGCFVACRLCWLQAPGHTKGHLPCEPRR